MEKKMKNRVCPVSHANVLDLNIRRLIHNPEKLLKPYISKGMKVLDFGCGPGFFTLAMVKLVGETGIVTASDLQSGMLEKLDKKIRYSPFENIIKLHQCKENTINISDKQDFVLIFYVLHEIPDQLSFLKEIKNILKPEGKMLIVEPKFHISECDFQKSLDIIKQTGFAIIDSPKVFFSRAIVCKI